MNFVSGDRGDQTAMGNLKIIPNICFYLPLAFEEEGGTGNQLLSAGWRGIPQHTDVSCEQKKGQTLHKHCTRHLLRGLKLYVVWCVSVIIQKSSD